MSYNHASRVQQLAANIEHYANHPQIVALLSEDMASKIPGRVFKNTPYYDYICEEYGKVELKSTSFVQQGRTLRVQGYQKKQGGFDHIHIVDALNDREFMIPHDVWFSFVGKAGHFWWAVNYENDTVRRSETAFLLKYEGKF